jgi:hypothetical protein
VARLFLYLAQTLDPRRMSGARVRFRFDQPNVI